MPPVIYVCLNLGLNTHLILNALGYEKLGETVIHCLKVCTFKINWEQGVELVAIAAAAVTSENEFEKNYTTEYAENRSFGFRGGIKEVIPCCEFFKEKTLWKMKIVLKNNSYILQLGNWTQTIYEPSDSDLPFKIIIEITPKSIQWDKIEDEDEDEDEEESYIYVQCAVHEGNSISSIIRFRCQARIWVARMKSELKSSEYSLYYSRGKSKDGFEELSLVDMDSLSGISASWKTIRISSARYVLDQCTSDSIADNEWVTIDCLANLQFRVFKKPNALQATLAYGEESLVKSFRAPLTPKGEAVRKDLLAFVRNCAESFRSSSTFFSPITSISQSSGTGKSRIAVELFRDLPGLYFVFRPPGSTGYPKQSSWAKDLQNHTFKLFDSGIFDHHVINCKKALIAYSLAVLDMLTAEINKLQEGDRKSLKCFFFY